MGGVFDLPNHPAVTVTWYEAHAFCNWLGKKLDMRIVLPSEAQWEKAARGPDGRTYPWGEKITPEHANYGDTGIGSTTTVGIFPKGASPCGALDMSGNVWEWCRTKWSDSHEGKSDDASEGTDARVLRGGASWSPVGLMAIKPGEKRITGDPQPGRRRPGRSPGRRLTV